LAGYVPLNHNMTAASFALVERPESFMSTVVAPSVSGLPNCISGPGGIDSSGLQNGYSKDHFPGKFSQILPYIFDLS
jgi:E1A/CREB-binding protein